MKSYATLMEELTSKIEVNTKAFATHHLHEAKANWTMPDDASIRKEYQIEYKKHLIHELDHDIFPTEDSFVKAVKASKTMVVTTDIDKKIAYRSRTRSMKDLLNLIKGYRSYPKFRNEKTLTDLETRIVEGKPTDMPMVVKFPNGGMRVFAGNTRMDIAFMHGINPTVIVIDLAKYMKESVVSEAIHGTVNKKNTWYTMSSSKVRANKDIQKDIYDIIRSTYANLGGHPDFPNQSSVPHDNTNIKVTDTDAPDDADATILSKKTPHGLKVTALGSDGGNDAKRDLITKIVEMLGKDGNYCEMSGKIAAIVSSKGAKMVENEALVRKVLTGKQITWHGNHPDGVTAGKGWYSRLLGGSPHVKAMFGKPRG